ncbi:hypothetical protein V1522DRAFT_393921 [Lipomyces starkeyi]
MSTETWLIGLGDEVRVCVVITLDEKPEYHMPPLRSTGHHVTPTDEPLQPGHYDIWSYSGKGNVDSKETFVCSGCNSYHRFAELEQVHVNYRVRLPDLSTVVDVSPVK